MNKAKMASCGIDCNECAQYKVTMEQDLHAAESLVEWFRSREWIGQDDGAEAVLRKAPLCKGCWSDYRYSGCENCDSHICCEEKQLNHCGECGSYPCEKYEGRAAIHETYKKAMERLLSLKETI
jgi:hypothetical protein